MIPSLNPKQQDLLQKAAQDMDVLRESPHNRVFQETQMRLVIAKLSLAGVLISDFLDGYYRNLYQPPKTVTPKPLDTPKNITEENDMHTCRGCGKQFSAKAFNGHGERRCLLKHGKEATK
ncbi:hypothetical protein [Runella zeae]|uniref:hypothetical protein n=1 Tax=Runella zeae TaxID=94255 RepID=UPI000415854F|nr:hypothetical protein [Runella zeae]